jgi:hypothetical protein
MIYTKFNVGDTVYAAETYEIYWANKNPYIVIDVLIKIDDSGQTVTYRIKQGEIVDTISEHLLFATYEECTKWCDEHN